MYVSSFDIRALAAEIEVATGSKQTAGRFFFGKVEQGIQHGQLISLLVSSLSRPLTTSYAIMFEGTSWLEAM